jgi:DNA invertase Pin-like site-specific DNA recombinase
MRAQQAKLEASCLVKNWTSRQVVCDEGHSAKTLKPLGLEALVALVASRRVAAVIVYKLDRFTRASRTWICSAGIAIPSVATPRRST